MELQAFVTHYLAIGLGAYLCAASMWREHRYKPTKMDILRGLAGIVLWPLVLWHIRWG